MSAKYVARQAILGREREVVAYELLFRDGPESVFRCDSIARATSSVIADSFLLIGLDALSSGRPVFVNFSREALLQGIPRMLPPAHLVVELLETVTPDEAVVRACRELSGLGYTIALDDFSWADAWKPVLAVADIVKVDFLATRGQERERLHEALRPFDVTLLAEKVETEQDFEAARRAGYALFQGFFFSRPALVQTRDVGGLESAHLRVLRAVSAPNVNLRALEDLIRRDLSLTYKLMRRANSVVFGRHEKSPSLRRALELLGLDEVRRWVALLVVAGLSKGRPSELVRSALLRARFCEELAPAFGLAGSSGDLFLVGLFAQLDALLGRPLREVVAELALPGELETVLTGGEGALAPPLRCALAWERGDWDAIDAIATTLRSGGEGLPDAYVGALEWLRDTEELID